MKLDEKVSEMMLTPMNKLPELAVQYLRYMSSRVGFCGEVCVTAFSYYCQAILQMKCKNKIDKITPEAKKWFDENKTLEAQAKLLREQETFRKMDLRFYKKKPIQ